MSNDDPFGSTDVERTFIMPSPGKRTGRPASPLPLPTTQAPHSVDELIPSQGLNPLIAAASPLLNAGPPLRASLNHPDPAVLHDTLARGIRAFEARAAKAGASPQHVTAARYVLCTFLDEMAASTPWGGSGVWGKYSLLVVFHNETWGGEKVFQLLAKLAENPAANRNLLELMYVVLALGFEGRYRVLDNGRSQLERLRERLLVMINDQRGPYERELSAHWKGVQVTRPTFLQLPMWAIFACLGVIAVLLLIGLRASLNSDSDPLATRIQNLRAKTDLPPPPPPVPATKRRLGDFLQKEIAANQVKVDDFDDRSIVTITGDGLFESGGTTVAEPLLPLIDRIGQALNRVSGAIEIIGHTDDRPIRSIRFKDNFQLSQERAMAVQQLLQKTVDVKRMKASGRGPSEPLASNSTPEGRAKNRRVAITLFPDNRDVAAP